ncbi:MAG TPA: hypothetical protein VGP66_04350 [Candidatus Acidoferrum sp.]|nr:hypothetical protein [Candidatus Acidoferrum sp.]
MLLVAGFVAFQLGKNEVNPILQLVVAAVVALIVAIQLVPHGPFHVRKPDPDLPASSFREDETYPAFLKQAYSPPHLTQFESREFSEPAWESLAGDDSFRVLQPFYVVYPKREFTAIAASLKLHGDKDYRDWQPVANSARPQSQAGHPDEHYQWILIAYVPPNASFDAKLKFRDAQSRLGVTVLLDLVASEDRSFQSVHLRLPAPAAHFAGGTPLKP